MELNVFLDTRLHLNFLLQPRGVLRTPRGLVELAINLGCFIRPFPRVPLFGWGWWGWLGLQVGGLVVVAVGWLARVSFFACSVFVWGERKNAFGFSQNC